LAAKQKLINNAAVRSLSAGEVEFTNPESNRVRESRTHRLHLILQGLTTVEETMLFQQILFYISMKRAYCVYDMFVHKCVFGDVVC
jgi:hypothetical protein